jgi:hypothetical protein
MIDIRTIRTQEVSDEVDKFMTVYGGSHVSLYEGWKVYPTMGIDPELLGQELTHVIREGNVNLTKRVLGRLRKVNATAEDKIVKSMLDGDDEVQPLGCLG